MNARYSLLTLALLLLIHTVYAQNKLSGFVSDLSTGERLIGASIVESNAKNGTATDNNGYFSLITKSKTIQVSYIGYQPQIIEIKGNELLNIALEPGTELEEVNVKGQNVWKFNLTTLSKQEMLSIPTLGGKPDVLKTLQLMPGIQSQQEGSSLLNVRGGNPGENLYLFDNIPIIYVNHLGGFASVFNPDMINNIEVYKGGFPAKYGGKLSSIVAITQREGDKSKLKGSLGIGITDASFSIEGPLLNKKASFLITGRKTLIDPLMMLASASGGDFMIYYGFHDINGKFSYRPNEKNSFFINFYQGDDYINYTTIPKRDSEDKGKLSNAWGNWLGAVRWNSLINSRLFVDNTLSYTHYRLNIGRSFHSVSASDTIDFKSNYQSIVKDLSARTDWQYKLMQNWSLDFGAKATLLSHIPNKIEQSNSEVDQPYEQVDATEMSVYLGNRFSLFNIIDANIGGRLVNYHSGSFNYLSPEPRVDINANLSKKHSLNFSYQSVSQFAHMMFTSGSIMNNEVWVPADEKILPATSVQYSVGWKGSFAHDMFQTELNLYAKTLNQLATYKEGYSNLMGDGGWRSKIETGGTGHSKGVEFLLKKAKGKVTGFVSYTLSKTTRQFPVINKGEEYLFEYDRPHSLSINLNRKLSDKWSVNALWNYQTGLPYTPVLGRQYTPVTVWDNAQEYVYEEALIYGKRNSERMKDYHRLDIGATYTTKTKHGRKAIWNFSVYNAYNRMNANAYYYGHEDYPWDYKGYRPLKKFQWSFFPIIPTVSYKVFFE
jgi:hypothetical protein